MTMGLFGWLRAFWQRDSIPPPGADILGAATLVKEKPPSITQGGEHVSNPYKLPHDAVSRLAAWWQRVTAPRADAWTAARIRANPPSVPPPIPPAPADILGAATLPQGQPSMPRSIPNPGPSVQPPPPVRVTIVPHDAVVIPPVPKLDDASERFARCVAEVLKHEGGYVDHPRDPGGATNRGITHLTLADWRGQPVTKADVQALTEKEAREIYRARFWNAIQGDRLPAGVDLAVFDFAVNSGPARAARVLQRQLGVPADGVIGPQTLAAVGKVDAARLASGLCRARLAWMRGLPTWDAFGKGWTARVVDVERVALEMAR